MPERVWADTLRNAGLPRRVRDGLLHDIFVKMEARRRPPSRISTYPRRRKEELPGPLGQCIRILPFEPKRQHDAPESSREIILVLSLDGLEMAFKRLADSSRSYSRPVLLAFAASNHNLPLLQIEVLKSKVQRDSVTMRRTLSGYGALSSARVKECTV